MGAARSKNICPIRRHRAAAVRARLAPAASTPMLRARKQLPQPKDTPMREITDEQAAEHKAKMEAAQKAQREAVAQKTEKRGVLIVNTGNGKGKSTAAFGLALRFLGNGMRVGVVQFIKGTWKTGEKEAFKAFGDRVVWKTMGEGFTWNTQDLRRDVAAAEAAWEEAKKMLADPDLSLVVLDELNIALRYEYLDAAQVAADLGARREGMHVVVTGRDAPAVLREAADTVSELTLEKHHYDAGVQAQRGIEF